MIMRSLFLSGFILATALPGARAEDAEGFVDYMAAVETAIREGRSADAMDLICRSDPHPSGKAVAEVGSARIQSFYGTCTDFEHKRYDEVFKPPANVEDLFRVYSDKMPWSAFNFTASSFGSVHSKEGVEVHGLEKPDGPGMMTIRKEGSPRVTIDLDRDGVPEVTYDGKEPTIAATLDVAIDRADDGRRVQWLIASPGMDPRQTPTIWLYRDGAAFMAILDPDGDAVNVNGRSMVIR